MQILLTNDDGIHAPGIHAAYQALLPLGDVIMVAPERPRSAAGHAITLHKPLRLTQTRFDNGITGWASSGTPTDCVTLGYDLVMKGRCDLVVSGINAGPNLGWDLTYSGTVAGAMEGAVLGLPAIAVSVAADHGRDAIDYQSAAAFTAQIARKLLEHPLPANHFLNVNVPNIPLDEIEGVRITKQGRREYVDRIIERMDPSGRPYYWQAGHIKDTPEDDTDVHAILEGFVSVTPIHLDMTAYSTLHQLTEWNLTK
jgi:5'-nucleotidase